MSEFDYSLLGQHGKDVYISANVEIKRPHLVSLGSHIAIDSYLYCTTAMILGSYIHISPHVSIIGGADGILWIGSFCTISAGVRIIVRGDEMLGIGGLVGPLIPDEYRDIVRGRHTIIKPLSSIGSNAVLMPDVVVGEGAVIGAGSFVNKDIPEWEIWAGSPAKFIKMRSKERMLEYAKELMKNE